MDIKILKERLDEFIGKTYDEIQYLIDKPTKQTNKSKEAYVLQQLFYKLFKDEILEKKGKNVFYFKEGFQVTVKSSRVTDNDDVQESASFPTIKPEIIHEVWETSSLRSQLYDANFIWCFWKVNSLNQQVLTKIKIFKLNEDEINEIKKVWEVTKNAFLDKTYHFPKINENRISHVRNNDGGFYKLVNEYGAKVKTQCFWLNNSFINENIYKN